MIINLKIVRVKSDYCDYLRKFDNKVSYNNGKLSENIKSRCCNFKLLEAKCLEYKMN